MSTPGDDDLLFEDDEPNADPPPATGPEPEPWRVLIVDDEQQIHEVSALALRGVTVDGFPLQIVSAHSGAEAREKLREHDDLALVLLDVVMETDDAGLRVAHFIRKELQNQAVRIVLRTGQPGLAPEKQVIRDYDINDYCSKTEMTADRLRTVVTGGIRSFRDIHTIEKHRAALAKVIHATALLFAPEALDQLIEATLTQLSTFLRPSANVLFFHRGDDAEGSVEDAPVVAGTGRFTGVVGQPLRRVVSEEVLRDLGRSLHTSSLLVTPTYGVYAYRHGPASDGAAAGIFMDEIGNPSEWERNIIEVFCANASMSFSNQRQDEQRAALGRAFGRFVPHEFLACLAKKSILDVEIGDCVKREMSVMFSDLRSFTTHVERMTPEEGMAFINAYMRIMERPIRDNGGFVDSYVGDAIMALFPRSADDAVRAGIDMLHALDELNRSRAAAGLSPLRAGVGLSTGPLMLGIIGGSEHRKAGVVGDCVNLAARVESVTKAYEVPFLIADSTCERLLDPSRYCLRVMDKVTVVGKSKPVTLHEVFDADPPERREIKLRLLPTFHEAISTYQRAAFSDALRLFARCMAEDPDDKIVAMYVERCQRHAKAGVPADWDGVEPLLHK